MNKDGFQHEAIGGADDHNGCLRAQKLQVQVQYVEKDVDCAVKMICARTDCIAGGDWFGISLRLFYLRTVDGSAWMTQEPVTASQGSAFPASTYSN